MARADVISVSIFIVGQIMALLFITLLQIVELRFFILFLLLMHIGIILFIYSKKRFLNAARNIKKYYRVVYGLMALYLPILLYKLPAAVLPYEARKDIIVPLTLVVAAVAVIVSLFNNIAIVRYIRSQPSETVD